MIRIHVSLDGVEYNLAKREAYLYRGIRAGNSPDASDGPLDPLESGSAA